MPALGTADAATEDALDRSPALTLFLERARATNPDLVVDDDSARVITGICRSVSGLPLALELAAARVKHLPLTAIRDKVGDRLDLLTGGPRHLPPRQWTMRDAVGWSYALLEPAGSSYSRSISTKPTQWAQSWLRCDRMPSMNAME